MDSEENITGALSRFIIAPLFELASTYHTGVRAMTDLHEELEAVLAKAAEYEMLGSLAVERDKREEYRTRAKFQRSIAEELRARLASPVVPHSLPHTFAG